MDVIRLTVGFYELGIFETCYRAHIGLKTAAPFRFNEGPAAFGAPDEMDVYTEKLACHALYNWIIGWPVKEIFVLEYRAFGARFRNVIRIPALRPGLLTVASSRLSRTPREMTRFVR